MIADSVDDFVQCSVFQGDMDPFRLRIFACVHIGERNSRRKSLVMRTDVVEAWFSFLPRKLDFTQFLAMPRSTFIREV